MTQTSPSSTQKNRLLVVGVSAVIAAICALGYLKWTQNPSSSDPQPNKQTESSNVDSPQSQPNPDLNVDSVTGLSKATVSLNTTQGLIKFKFFTQDAPNTTKRLVELIQKKFYNGLVFHRYVPGFVVQTGDPLGNGTGGSGQNLKAEFNQRIHQAGTLAMARAADPDSADSQFYIALAPQPHLDHGYTIFGQVTEGLDVVQKIRQGDKINWAIIE